MPASDLESPTSQRSLLTSRRPQGDLRLLLLLTNILIHLQSMASTILRRLSQLLEISSILILQVVPSHSLRPLLIPALLPNIRSK
jgi:hypothetical protein